MQAGDRVAIFSATRYEWAILDLAILAVGAVTVPIYETSSAEQVRWVLQDSGRVLAFAETDAHATMVTELTGELPALAPGAAHRRFGPQGARPARRGRRVGRPGRADRARRGTAGEDPATLIYTSGTTGRPKGCQLTHSNLVYETRGTKEMPADAARQGTAAAGVPAAGARARPGADAVARSHNKVTVGFTSDIKNLVPMFAVFKPTVVVSVPRVFEKVYNTAEQNAANDGKGRIFEIAAQTAVDWSEASRPRRPGPAAARQARIVRPAGVRQAARRAGR